MSKVLVDRKALEEAAELLEMHSSSSGSTEWFAAGELRDILAQPAEAEGVKRWALDVDCLYPSEEGGWCEYGDHLAALSAVTAERDRLAEKVEKVRSRDVSVSSVPDAVIPNALDAWGRPVKQHLPYDFSGNPGVSATQYCNGWNDSGSYWKAHCIDLQTELDQLRAEVEALRNKATPTPTTVPSHE